MSNKYYPSLKNLITLDAIPDSVDFIKSALTNLFSKIHYKDFQSSVSSDGSVAFYSLRIVTKKKIECDLFFGLKFILNRDFDNQGISSFPVTLDYSWPIIAYLKAFDLQNFSFSPREFYEMGLIIFNISEEEVLDYAVNTLVVTANPSVSPINQFVDDVNSELGSILTSPIPYPTSDKKLDELSIALKEQLGEFGSIAVFLTYILSTDLATTKQKVQSFFEAFIPHNIEEYLLDIIKPEARVTTEITASIEFPRNILLPWNDSGTERLPEPEKSYFNFGKAILFADTKAGIGYQLELAGTLEPKYAEIGNTGILLQIESLKLDLSKNSNIAEATADGRPDSFIGVYARALSITLPARWFKTAPQNTATTTLRLGGYDLLVGTGGISGKIMLESVPSFVTGGNIYYYEDKFAFKFPVTVLSKSTNNEVVEVEVPNIGTLKSKLFPSNANNSIPPCNLKFPVSIEEIGTNVVKTFDTVEKYQQYLNSISSKDPNTKLPTLWKTIGANDGFKVGFTAFDITFKQKRKLAF